MRKTLVCLMGLMMIVGLVSFAQTTEVEVWVWGQLTVDLMAGLESAFEAAYPSYDAVFVPKAAAEYNTILTTALQGGVGPDVFFVRTNPMPAEFAAAGFIQPVDEIVPLVAAYDDSQLAALSYEGRPYGIPYATVAFPIYYNPEIFAANGVSIPQTWAEFLAVCQTLADNGVTPIAMTNTNWVMSEIVHPIVAASFLSDAWLEDLVAGNVDYTAPEFVRTYEALEEMRPYFAEGWEALSYQDMRVMFANGEAAMVLDGNWSAPSFLTMNEDAVYDFFILPGPDGPGRMYWRLDAGWGINADLDPEVDEAAVAFLNFLAGPTAGEILGRDLGLLTVQPGTRLFLAADITTRMNEARDAYGVSIQYGVGGPFDWNAPTVSSSIGETTAGVLLDAITPAEAAAMVQETVDQQ